jgi:nifR3 family TIM-barrel protein
VIDPTNLTPRDALSRGVFLYAILAPMYLGFWEKLKKPIIVLAPMADVTDAAFRRVIAKHGKPDVMWTEFVSADGLFLGGPRARRILLKDFIYTESERPIIAQIFTSNPERMKKAARLVARLGFDGIDINMGCPDRSIEKQISGAALIKHPRLAQELIRAAQEGAIYKGRRIPVSVKTRIGYHKNEIDTWLPALLETEPAVITLHARTRKEMSKVPANWEIIRRAVEIRNASEKKTLIFGNGDVRNREEAIARVKETGCDGVMIGRGIFGNPWLFNARRKKEPTPREKIRVLIEHITLYDDLLGKTKSFHIMKKHFKAYISGWDGAAELRGRLMETKSAKEAVLILKKSSVYSGQHLCITFESFATAF